MEWKGKTSALAFWLRDLAKAVMALDEGQERNEAEIGRSPCGWMPTRFELYERMRQSFAPNARNPTSTRSVPCMRRVFFSAPKLIQTIFDAAMNRA
jgi:hypothetical protein